VDHRTSAQLILGFLTLAMTQMPVQASASTGGISPLSGVVPRGSTDTGFRYQMTLSSRSDVLVGQSDIGSVATLVLSAPGQTAGHVIVREIDAGDGTTALLITAPGSLANRIRRVTLLLRRERPDVDLWEQVDTHWARQRGEPLELAVQNGSVHHLAFSVSRLGSFWLVPRGGELNSEHISPKALLGGGMGSALAAWFWPAVVLGLAGLVARAAHLAQETLK
jgi:hypothetical protein